MYEDIRSVHNSHPTSDGWHLRMFHYPAQTKKKVKTPVILCHGLAANKNSCDFGDPGSEEWMQYSLAAYLSQGMFKDEISFDTWVVELRGRGDTPTFSPKKHPEKYIWSVDDYVNKDVPTILSHVQAEYTTKQKMLWVGKSMGGMIAYAYGQREESHDFLKGVVTLGSPTMFEYKNPLLEFISRLAPRNVALPINISQVLQRFPEVYEAFKRIGAAHGNIDEDIFDRYLKQGMDNMVSSKVFSHFSVFFRHNTFCEYPVYPWLYDIIGYGSFKKLFNHYDYKKNLNRFTLPLLAVAGQADKEAPPKDVYETVKHVGSNDKTYQLFSKSNGFSADYGHLDLNLGKKAKEEIYPYVADWLYQHK